MVKYSFNFIHQVCGNPLFYMFSSHVGDRLGSMLKSHDIVTESTPCSVYYFNLLSVGGFRCFEL